LPFSFFQPVQSFSDRFRSWGSSFRAFSLHRAFVPLGIGNLLDVEFHQSSLSFFWPDSSAPPPSRLCSLRRFATFAGGMNRCRRPLPSWFSVRPLGSSPRAAFRRLRAGSPRGLPLRPLPKPRPRIPTETALQGVHHGRVGLPLSRLPPLVVFLHLVLEP